jgi:UDP-N-acetylglucosamine acyltransferase
MSKTQIHPSAVIADTARIGEGVVIGPFCVVGPDVTLGRDVRLHSHVVVDGHTEIGAETQVYPFAVLGTAPQDLKFKGEKTRLVIGERNRIREHVTMNPGTEGGGGITRVGSDCLFMVNAHVAHDCQVGNRVIMANNATLAGHVWVGDYAILGGLSAVHQFVRIGAHAMIGGMSGVESDVIPYGLVKGERASLHGLNLVGMERRGYSREDVTMAREAYRTLFRTIGTLAERIESTAADYAENPVVSEMVTFLRDKSKHGVCQPRIEDAA